MKSILLVGNTKAKSAIRLKQEAEKMGIVFDFISSQKLSFDGISVFVKEDSNLSQDIMGYDTYIFRALNSTHLKETRKIAMFLDSSGKRVVEHVFALFGLPEDKDVPESKKGLYQVPKTIDEAIEFPVVAKTFNSSMGRGVRKINSSEQLAEFASNSDRFFLQEFFDIEYDTRVLVIGGKVLGGFNRFKKDGEEILTTAIGGFREKANLSDKQIESAIEVVDLKGLEIAGVDMFSVNGVIYILEVNSSPQFRVLEKYTGVNIAREILEYL